MLPPFYYKGVPDEGVLRYLEAVAAAAPGLPLYLYNFPALSGVAYTPSLVKRLMGGLGDRLAGLKDSSGDLAYAREVAALRPGFAVFPSNEAALIEVRGGAFAGCISATANLNARFCAAAWREGDRDALKTAVAIRALFDGRALVPGIKAVLAAMMDDPALAATAAPLMPTDAPTAAWLVSHHARLSGAWVPALQS